MMRTLRMEELKPGKRVWLEDNGLAFKTLRLRRAFILRVSPVSVVFFPFLRLPAASYSTTFPKAATWTNNNIAKKTIIFMSFSPFDWLSLIFD